MQDSEQMLSSPTTIQDNKEKKLIGSNVFVDVHDMFEGMSSQEKDEAQNKIYEDYAKAMKMRGREPLEEDRFFRHFFEGSNTEKSLAFGGRRDGYLLGVDVNDVFIPTHFAPVGLRQGYRLIKDLLGGDKSAALFITQDLVETIQKMEGWKVLPFKIKADFRGNVTEKTLVVTRWSVLKKLAVYHAKNKIKDMLNNLEFKMNQIGEKAKILLKRDKANADDVHEEVEEYVMADEEAKQVPHPYSDAVIALRKTRLFEDDDE